MTDKIKIAASILEDETEVVSIPKKIKIPKDIEIQDFSFIEENEMDIEEANNVFLSVLEKYQLNSFDLFNLKEINKTLDLNFSDKNSQQYNIDLLLYRIATNLNTSLLVQKEEDNLEKNIKLHLSDLEKKFEFLIKEIQKINSKISRIEDIKNKISKENNIIIKYLVESDNMSLEKQRLENIELKIQAKRRSIFDKVNSINKYIEEKIKVK